MLVASLILQEKSEVMTFTDLYKNCRKLYSYIKARRNVPMIDDLPPSYGEVRKTAKSLGFKVVQTQHQKFKRTQRALEVNLEKKSPEWKVLLGLSYYSNTLLQGIKLDSVISKLLLRHYSSKQQPKMTMEQLTKKVLIYRNLVRYEFIVRLEKGATEEAYLELVGERLRIL